MKIIILIVGMLVVLGLILSYVYMSVERCITLFLKDKSRKFISVTSLIISASLLIPLFLGALTWGVAVLHMCVFMIFTQLINFLIKKIFKGKEIKLWDYIYRLAIIPLICTALVMSYGYVNMKNIIKTEYTVSSDKDISEDGYKVALLADIHYGNATDEESMEKLVNEISEEDVDMVLLCGDVVDENTTLEELQEVFNILGKIDSTYGTYFVYGNHDLSTYTTSPNYTQEDLDTAVDDNRITILRDESIEITDDFVLVGRKDYDDRARLSIEELVQGIDSNKFILVMDHQPVELTEKAEAGVDLQVSGHTHAGQLFPGGQLMNLVNFFELNYGEKTFDNMDAVVTTGVSGWGFPVRTSEHSEYVILNIE